MGDDMRTATMRAFATPELFESIISCLLDDVFLIKYGEDPRSMETYQNADILLHLLHCSQVNRTWYSNIRGSKHLQRALFLSPEQRRGRSWDLDNAPPTIFKAYHYRFWHLSFEASGNKYCAYLIITRRDLPDLAARARTGQGRTIQRMLLSQPPCNALDATIWEEKDESKEYLGRTTVLREPRIYCDDGLTLGMVHESVNGMFREHPDVAAIKLTTA
ncbi:hypothetical protein LTR53_015629 [Teratosphaeriaceae sp. CCFEE 6253]|nr:hypothetical protein LTR53_015629 [Teratosphaeriaceae sp. CCFEE 6253]